MPTEVFGPGYAFLPKDDLLTFDEILRVVRVMVPLRVGKIRLTGGEPLLRRGIADLVSMIVSVDGVRDLAMTTNGILLAHHAEELVLAGMSRVTVSLDALDPKVFAKMNGTGAKVERVVSGIMAAKNFGLPVKVNAVIQRGVNEQEILPLAHWALETEVDLRFIEFMDVGETNSWNMDEVVTGGEILVILSKDFKLIPRQPAYRGEVAVNWRHRGSEREIGLIQSVSKPFCADCQRLRLSADGRLFTCLFAGSGHGLREILRSTASDETVSTAVRGIWSARSDRYSELRGEGAGKKAEMSYLGG